MVKLFLSTPCYGGLCLEKYMIGVIKLQLLLIREGIQLMIDKQKMRVLYTVHVMLQLDDSCRKQTRNILCL